ncbi:cysteine hydrolase [Massilia sp. G4R7]|uniref:Cysteine hydrolase n=1 Tax=Massilia phyllostachyos TaxID=2898585 RepID=A0ABS8QBD5_9BURK|nr:cysteine hydrolase family protein [Massilia phyllostachyos]MCD2519057.1 cysteine hydrolase [Massilia phyllostachyos]
MSHDSPALILIDMQQCMASPAAGERNNPRAEENIALLLAAWRERGAPVVHVRHVSRSPGSGFAPGQPGAAFQPAFAPRADEHVVEKNVPDAFVNSTLERWLRVRGIARLVVVGVSTNISVECSVRSAGNLGFDVTAVEDATFTFARADHAGVARSADEVHAMSLANLDGEYAAVANTAQVLAAI